LITARSGPALLALSLRCSGTDHHDQPEPMQQPTYGTNWERDLARCAAALERLVELQEAQPRRQPKREGKP
jgi:hypothetical protein